MGLGKICINGISLFVSEFLWVDASLDGAEFKLRPFEILASYNNIVWASMTEPLAAISTL
jgi:hypothetical protein